MKKVYNAPYLKVVSIKNDILTSSVTVDPDGNNVSNLAPGRHGMWDEDFDGEDLY